MLGLPQVSGIHLLLVNYFLVTRSQLHPGEAAPVEVEHTVPALGIPVGAELGVAAGVVVEAIHPALRVTEDQLFRAWGLAGLVTAGPALSCLPAVIRDTQPALLHALLLTEDPPVALWNGVADGDAVLERRDGELVRVDAVVDEASCGCSVPRDVGEEGLTRVADHSVLLHARGPARLS